MAEARNGPTREQDRDESRRVIPVDVRRFLKGPAPRPDLPEILQRRLEHHGAIIRAATSHPTKYRIETAVRCRRTQDGSRCPGRLLALRTEGDRIHWVCPHCRDRGILMGWSGTLYDLTEPLGSVPKEAEEWDRTFLTPGQYELLQQIPDPSRSVARVLHGARWNLAGVLLDGRFEAVEELAGYAFLQAESEPLPARAEAFRKIAQDLAQALGQA